MQGIKLKIVDKILSDIKLNSKLINYQHLHDIVT